MIIKGDIVEHYRSTKGDAYVIYQYGHRWDAYLKNGDWVDYSDVSIDDLKARIEAL